MPTRRSVAFAMAVLACGSLCGCKLPGLSKADNATLASSRQISQPVSTTSCQTSESGSNGASHSVDVMSVFRTTVFRQVRRDCAGCHGASQTPKFAVSDESKAYSVSKGLANLDDLSSSSFIRKVKDGHCGSTCATDASEMKKNLEEWRAAENAPKTEVSACTTTGEPEATPTPSATSDALSRIVSEAKALPTPLPSGTAFTTLRFDLGTATPANPDLSGVIFEVEMQQFTAPSGSVPGSYRFRKPKLATANHPIYLKDVRILINGKQGATDESFDDIDTTVSPQTIPAAPTPLPFPLLSSDTALVLQDKADGSDRMSLSFEKVEKTSAATCKNLALYQSAVKSVMQTRCVSCHTNTGNTGYRKFSMTGTDDVVCGRALQRANRSAPDTSPLVVMPLRAMYGHPTTQFNSTEADAWVNWINSEK